ncbi:MAG: hypothetical protein DRJ65_06990 [Acidobacteria bacterium]|nr:MAG: hypothetical protein DRJ65_06990 [Acidobacteriota bacterium]
MLHSASGRIGPHRVMTKDTKPVTPPLDGMLDLDEPEFEAPSVDEGPAPEWSGNELLQIDVKGKIWVRGGRFFDGRVVGKVGGEDGEAVIAMLADRFQALEDRWLLLEKDVSGIHNMVRHIKSLRSFIHWVEGAKAIGDFEALLEKASGELERIETQLATGRAAKEQLIDEAEKLADSNSWRSTADTEAELMERWKRAGAGGGDEDEILWQRFKTARSRFFDRRYEHGAEVRENRRTGQQAKEDLITQAEALNSSTDWGATFDAMQDLMEQWKRTPSAGRKTDDELWNRFRAAREPFFEARKKQFAENRRQQSRGARDQGRPRGRSQAPRDRGGSASPGARRSSNQGSLHASLAELVGPLRDMFPADRKKEEDD